MNRPPTADRRVARRAAVRMPVEVAVDEAEPEGRWITSLSTTGVFIVGETPSPGSKVSLSFSLPGTRFGLQGAVVRIVPPTTEGDHPGFGVAFTHAPPAWRAVAHFLMSQPGRAGARRPPDTRERVLLVAAIVRGTITRQQAAARHGVSVIQLFEWERAIRRANERVG